MKVFWLLALLALSIVAFADYDYRSHTDANTYVTNGPAKDSAGSTYFPTNSQPPSYLFVDCRNYGTSTFRLVMVPRHWVTCSANYKDANGNQCDEPHYADNVDSVSKKSSFYLGQAFSSQQACQDYVNSLKAKAPLTISAKANGTFDVSAKGKTDSRTAPVQVSETGVQCRWGGISDSSGQKTFSQQIVHIDQNGNIIPKGQAAPGDTPWCIAYIACANDNSAAICHTSDDGLSCLDPEKCENDKVIGPGLVHGVNSAKIFQWLCIDQVTDETTGRPTVMGWNPDKSCQPQGVAAVQTTNSNGQNGGAGSGSAQ